MILVTGATGTVGGALCGALAALKLPHENSVRILARDPAKLPPHVEFHVARGAYDDPAALDRALDGVTALFLLTKPRPEQPALERSIAAAARRHGVRRLVRLSVMAADAGSSSPVRRWHGESEAAVADSGIPLANLRANFFMQNFKGFARGIAAKGVFSVPAGEARVSMVDVRDIADCAAVLLTEPAMRAGDFTLTGPRSLSFDEVAALAGAARGAPVVYRPSEIPDFIARMISAGTPQWLAEALGALYRDFQDGVNGPIDSSVEKLTGRPARSLETYLSEIASALRGH